MLLRFAIKTSFLIFLACIALVLLSIRGEYDNRVVSEFLAIDPGCEQPCWLGIQPGVTGVNQTVRLLKVNPWVENVQTSFNFDLLIGQPINGYITWNWTVPELQRLMPGGGWIDITRSRVRAIRLVTTAKFGDLWLLLGQPDEGSLRPSGAFGEIYAVHLAVYRERGLMLRSLVPYPVKVYPYWQGQVEIFIQADIARDTRYRQPCWLAC